MDAQNIGKPKNIGDIISFKDLMKIYDDKFIEEWYENEKQKEEYREKGKKTLRKFYDDLIEKGDTFIIPRLLEQPFNIKIGDYILTGKIDRVDVLPDGTCEIIDYKTGEHVTLSPEEVSNISSSILLFVSEEERNEYINNKPLYSRKDMIDFGKICFTNGIQEWFPSTIKQLLINFDNEKQGKI